MRGGQVRWWLTGYVVDVEDEEGGPEEVLEGTSDYGTGGAEDLGSRYIR